MNDATETDFQKAVIAHNENPSEELRKKVMKLGFEAIKSGDHDEQGVTTALANLAKPSATASPYNVANEALLAVRDIAFTEIDEIPDKDAKAALSKLIDNARGILGNGATLDPAVYTFYDRAGTADEAVLMTLSQTGFVFGGNIPMNDLAQRMIMTLNNNLTFMYSFHYDRGYRTAVNDGTVPVDLMARVNELLPIAKRSGRSRDKKTVKFVEAHIEHLNA